MNINVCVLMVFPRADVRLSSISWSPFRGTGENSALARDSP